MDDLPLPTVDLGPVGEEGIQAFRGGGDGGPAGVQSVQGALCPAAQLRRVLACGQGLLRQLASQIPEPPPGVALGHGFGMVPGIDAGGGELHALQKKPVVQARKPPHGDRVDGLALVRQSADGLVGLPAGGIAEGLPAGQHRPHLLQAAAVDEQSPHGAEFGALKVKHS